MSNIMVFNLKYFLRKHMDQKYNKISEVVMYILDKINFNYCIHV